MSDPNKRFVVRRDGKLEPLTGCTSRAEADDRIAKEITGGQVQEIDLYEYVGTARPKRVVEMVNLFEGNGSTGSSGQG